MLNGTWTALTVPKSQRDMKAYQLSKIRNKYWWTGTVKCEKMPKDCDGYKWVKTKEEAETLSGRNIK